jgi:hypothetical protein
MQRADCGIDLADWKAEVRMLFVMAALAHPLASGPITLDPRVPSWSTDRIFNGRTTLSLDVRHPPLHASSAVTVRVDGVPMATVSLDGTPVPIRVDLGALEGRHTVTLSSRLREPWADDCEPGNPWVTLTGDLDGASPQANVAPVPGELRNQLSAGTVSVVGGDAAMRVEAVTWMRRWGVGLDGGDVPIRLIAAGEEERWVNWQEGELVVSGDAELVRELALGRSLTRCAEWPCAWGPGRLVTPRTGTVLRDQGFPKGLTLEGRATTRMVLPQPAAPVVSSRLLLQVETTSQQLDPSSTFTVLLEGHPLGTWSADRLQSGLATLDVPIPEWAYGFERLAFELDADLHAADTRCVREARAPWITLTGASRLVGEAAPSSGLAARARGIRTLPVATFCPEVPVSMGAASILASLRPRGGWVESCTEPEVVLTDALAPGFHTDGRGTWGLVEGDPVPADDNRWVIHDGTPLTVHVPKWNGTPAELLWTALPEDQVVSTVDGWSTLGEPQDDLVVLASVAALPSDNDAWRARVDLATALGLLLLFLAAGAWFWRSRGNRDGWVE